MYLVITLLAFFLPGLPDQRTKTIMFWTLAMMVATSQGGIQALSRSMFARMIPKDKSAEFFGFYNIFGKFSTMLGPLIMGVVTHITHDSRFGVLSILALFIGGGIILLFVEPHKNSRQ